MKHSGTQSKARNGAALCGMLASMRTIALGASLLLGCSGGGAAQAQEANYPTRAIRLVVGFAAGGGVDVVARLFADRMSTLLGQPVVVENRGGAAGSIAAKQVTSAEPDGYTVLVNSNPMAIHQLMNPKLGLNIERDLRPVASVAPQSIIIVGAPDLAAGSLQEVIAIARQRKLNYGTTGAGSVSHLVVEYLFTALSGVRMEHIPFQGAAPALTAVTASQVEVASTTVPPAVALVNAGKIKGIAVTSPARSQVLPQVPTVIESGLQGIPVTAWTGFFVPAKTSDKIANHLMETILKVADMPEIKARLTQLGFESTSMGAEQFRLDLARELKTWAEVIEKANIQSP